MFLKDVQFYDEKKAWLQPAKSSLAPSHVVIQCSCAKITVHTTEYMIHGSNRRFHVKTFVTRQRAHHRRIHTLEGWNASCAPTSASKAVKFPFQHKHLRSRSNHGNVNKLYARTFLSLSNSGHARSVKIAPLLSWNLAFKRLPLAKASKNVPEVLASRSASNRNPPP